MKNLLFAICMLVGMSSFAQLRSASLTASGLTCSMCSRSIYKALLKVPAVKTVEPNVENSSFVITFKEDAHVVLDDIKKAVTDAGFSVATMQVTASFDSAEVYNDAHISLGGSTFHFLNVPRQTLQGNKTFTIVDKNFLPAAEHKKYSKYTAMKCFETGTMSPCCPKSMASNRIYHVTL